MTEDAASSFLTWGVCGGLDNGKGKDAECSIVLKYGMKRDFNAWLKTLGPAAPVKTLTELRMWNVAHQKAGAIKYGQAQLDISDEMDVQMDRSRYQADRAKDIRLAATEGIDAVMKKHNLDALLFPGPSSAAIGAKAGYPTVLVPFALVPNVPFAGPPGGTAGGAPRNPFPEGFEPEAEPLRRRLHRPGVQRTAAPRTRFRVRAGDEASRPADFGSVRELVTSAPSRSPRGVPRRRG